LDQTLTTGVISALNREIESVTRRPIQGVIQSDAAINPGNSGGPLLDSAGRLIGVNTAIYSPSGASAGIGFAIPVDTVERVVRQLIEDGRVERAYLGVGTVSVTPALAQRLGLAVQSGALILELAPDGPAARAGLRGAGADARTGALVAGGDVITSIDGEEIAGPEDVARVIGAKQSGTTSHVSYVRGDSQRTVEVTLGSQPGR
jgi:S1-C subfamily serine protease